MRLCLDENLRSKELRRRLLAAGHELVEPDLGSSDPEVWAVAQAHRAAVLTGNAVDFVPLAEASVEHAGLLLVYRESDRRRDMTAADVVTALGRVEAAYAGVIHGQIVVLNRLRR